MNQQELRGQFSREWYQKEYGVANILTTNISHPVSRHISKNSPFSSRRIDKRWIDSKKANRIWITGLNNHMKDKIQEYLD